MSLTFPHSRAFLPTSLAHVFLPTSLFAPPSSIPVFPALLAHKPLGPLCIRAAFLLCHSRSFWCREGFPYHPTEFRTFGLLLAPLPYSSHAVPHTELLFQLLGVTKLISHLFPFFFSPFRKQTMVFFSHAPFTSASGRFTPAWLPGSCCSCSPEQGIWHLPVPFSLCCIARGVRKRERSGLGPVVQLSKPWGNLRATLITDQYYHFIHREIEERFGGRTRPWWHQQEVTSSCPTGHRCLC